MAAASLGTHHHADSKQEGPRASPPPLSQEMKTVPETFTQPASSPSRARVLPTPSESRKGSLYIWALCSPEQRWRRIRQEERRIEYCVDSWCYLPLAGDKNRRASLVAHWLRICLPMQGTCVLSLACKNPTCCRATKPVSCNH